MMLVGHELICGLFSFRLQWYLTYFNTSLTLVEGSLTGVKKKWGAIDQMKESRVFDRVKEWESLLFRNLLFIFGRKVRD